PEEWCLLNFLKYLDSGKSLDDRSEAHQKYKLLLNSIKDNKEMSEEKRKKAEQALLTYESKEEGVSVEAEEPYHRGGTILGDYGQNRHFSDEPSSVPRFTEDQNESEEEFESEESEHEGPEHEESESEGSDKVYLKTQDYANKKERKLRRTEIEIAYTKMKHNMWKLSSGKFVEKLYNIGKQLEFEQ
ncbi:6290_t:CDS:2, partial [Acaulospora colombiana]